MGASKIMITESHNSIDKWLRKSKNRKINVTYRKARHYLNSLILSPNFTSEPNHFRLENFSAQKEDSFQLLDDAINSILVSYLWLEPHDIKISELAKKKGWKRSNLVTYLQRMKSQLVERASFLHFLTHCLDKDPFAEHNPAFTLHISNLEESISVLREDEERLEQVLDGVALFLQTPVDRITCMPKYAATLLKVAAPCWIFLSLNLARNEQPSYMVIDNLLSKNCQADLKSKHPAMEKILRCLATALFQCLSVCGGQKIAEIVFERYGLTDFKDQSLLADIRNGFFRFAIDCCPVKNGHAKFKRALSRRDSDHMKFDRKYKLAGLDDIEEYTHRLMGVVYDHIPAQSGWQIKDRFIYLNLFQKILNAAFVGEDPFNDDDSSTNTGPHYTVSKTFNFLLFEHIASFTTIAVRNLGVDGSLDPFFFSPETIQDEFWFPDKKVEILKPFYAPTEDGYPFYPPNEVKLGLDECEFLHQVTLLLFSTLNPADAAYSGEIDTMRNYLDKLFIACPPISKYADKEFYGIPPSENQRI